MVSFLVLDFERPKESLLCLKSIRQFAKFPYQLIYLSNGGRQDYVWDYYSAGLIHKLILRSDNSGCGLGTRELFQSAETDFCIYVQCDQFMIREFTSAELDGYVEKIINKEVAYVDLAGNQGHGNYSERAHLISRHFYNSIPNGIGGPGRFADHKWTEQCVQEYMRDNRLGFYSAPLLFADNGKVSRREYPCGGVIVQFTDTKALFIERPIKRRIDFPNLTLTDKEWEQILNGTWINGTVPEHYLKTGSSFLCWERPYKCEDVYL